MSLTVRYPPMGDRLKRVLWENVAALMHAKYGGENINKLSREAGVGPASIQRIKEAETSVGLDVVAKVAKALHVDPWQLLFPKLHDSSFVSLCRAYTDADEAGRQLLDAAAETVRRARATRTGTE